MSHRGCEWLGNYPNSRENVLLCIVLSEGVRAAPVGSHDHWRHRLMARANAKPEPQPHHMDGYPSGNTTK